MKLINDYRGVDNHNQYVKLRGIIGTCLILTTEYSYFSLNTSTSIKPCWWRIILPKGSDITQLEKYIIPGTMIELEGTPNFKIWTVENKKGNSVLEKTPEGKHLAKTFTRRECFCYSKEIVNLPR